MKTTTTIFLALVLSAVGCVRSTDRSHLPALAEKVSSLEKGMPKANVDALLGSPYVYGALWSGPPERPIDTGKLTAFYDGRDKLVTVEFDQEEKLLAFHAMEPPPLPPGQYQGFGLIKPKGE